MKKLLGGERDLKINFIKDLTVGGNSKSGHRRTQFSLTITDKFSTILYSKNDFFLTLFIVTYTQIGIIDIVKPVLCTL